MPGLTANFAIMSDLGEPRMRVLQIEDDAKTAQTVEMILTSEGHDCDTAACGGQALELARAGEYDIILLDMGLPDIDGYEVLNRLRGAGITTPVVIQSGLVLRKNEVRGLGVEDYLAKPFGRRELTESLQTVLPGSGGHG
jgi:two-component system cell cycle response regulator CtrA